MAFKSLKTYNDERFNGLFLLRNHGDSADVVFLYRNLDDVLIADTHYIKSADYSGYVQCCGRGCPACGKGIRVQSKLFIPVYNLTDNQIQFWDRSIRFENQLSADVFEKYPNPSDFVFRITRDGAAGDINTTYKIQAIGRNSSESYQDILNKFNITMPEYYETVCKDMSAAELSRALASSGGSSGGDDLPNYQVTPRTSSSSNTQPMGGVPPVHDQIPEAKSITNMLPADDLSPLDGDEDIDDVVF